MTEKLAIQKIRALSLSLCVSINNITQIVTLLLTSGFGDGDVDDGVVLILLSLHSQVAGTS